MTPYIIYILTIFISGNEGYGISSDIKSLCSKLISIFPRNCKNADYISCMNVSAAAGI